MAQDQRSPRQHVIDVFIAIDIKDVRTLAASDKRRRPANAAKGPYRGIHAARNQLLSAGK